MLRAVVSSLLIFFASQLNAQSCPALYRFVDFGLEGQDGITYRGGPVFRAEDFDGTPLLVWDRTHCVDVLVTSKDGRGNPIPVVTSIDYNPASTGIALTHLRVAVVQDPHTAAEENAREHRARLEDSQTEQTRGSDYLCVSDTASSQVSCQLVAPFPNNSPAIVYCNAQMCAMLVLVIAENLVVSAAWNRDTSEASTPDKTGSDISDKAQQVREFLIPLSTTLKSN